MKKKLVLIAIILIFVVGVGVLSYPFISSVVNNYASRVDAEDYQKRVAILPEAEKSAFYEEARGYNHSLNDNVILKDPFDAEAYQRIGDDYYNAFNINGEGLIGYIDIPKINTYLPVYHGTSEEVLAQYAGHLAMTSLPIGGASTHAVISAHSAYPGKIFFDYLSDMTEGDDFYIHILDKTLKYQVDSISVVEPEETKKLRITPGEDYVTLVTCTPYSVNTHRLLVRGKRVAYDDTQYIDIKPPVIRTQEGSLYFLGCKIPLWAVGIGIAAVVAAGILIPIMVIRRSRKGKHAR